MPERNPSQRAGSAWAALRGQPGALAGLALVGLLVLAALLAPLLAPHDPLQLHALPRLTPPSAAAWLGSDAHGRDLLSRVLWGGRISLSVAALSVALAALLGTLLGAVAGYAAGWPDRLLMGLADLVLAMPRLVLVLAVVGLLRLSGVASLGAMVVVIGATSWMGTARLVRTRVLEQRRQPLAVAGQALGLSPLRILWRHLLPMALAPVLVHLALQAGEVILLEASLSFLGLGVPAPMPSWGAIIADGRAWLHSAWWIATMPGLVLGLAVASFTLLGEGLRAQLSGKQGETPKALR